MSVAPYPHIKMGVRDESIYVGLDTEILPLDKPLYMVKAQKGPVGKPVWCPTYTKACQTFGESTFNKRSKYWSEASYFLLKTLVSNGAFIMRVADDTAKAAKVYIECGIKEADVPQWKRNEITGQFALDNFGERIGLYKDANGKGQPLKDDEGEAATGALVTADEAGPVYGETADTAAILGKEYYMRSYAAYKYAPYTADTASKDMVAYKGSGTPTPTAYTKATLTDAIIAANFVYTKNSESQYVICENLTVETADEATEYYTLAYTTYTGHIFKQGDVMTDDTSAPTEAQVGVWLTRTPDLTAGYEYTKLSEALTGFVTGDKFLSDGLVTSADGATIRGYAGQVYEQTGNLVAGNYKEQATIPGYRLVWRAITRITNDNRSDDSTDVNPQQTGGYTWYPMMSFAADSEGKWGEAFGFRFFYDHSNNTLAGVETNGAVKYTIAPVELKEDDTTPTAIVNAYGEQVVVGTIKEGVIDPTTELEISLKKLVPSQYSGSRELPCSMTIIPDSFATIGKMIMQKELDSKEAIETLYDGLDYFMVEKDDGTEEMQVKTFVENLLGSSPTLTTDNGHMANIVTCVDPSRVPYFASYVMGTSDDTTEDDTTLAAAGAGVVDMIDDSWFHLLGGADGDISDYAIERMQRYQIDACVAGTQDYLVDYLRCPYNNIIDTGVSLKTKKSYLDFMGVRDNLTVFLTPQQLWANQDGSYPAQLSRYEDESVGAVLRSYGLLMREDVENATEANRCIIFLASGINSDHDYANDGLVASTLWIALKNAEYLNKTYIDKEPVERPNSEITCYDGGMTWTAASEETRSRCWNAGLNYAQYCEQTVIHYASVRSIYRYDTSVLCDATTVRAVTFCKDIIRKEWAIWAGSKRKAEDLNGRITKALNEKLAAMLNNKYTFAVKVYQTDEDKKYGYVRHVDLELTSPAQNRVWLATIICKREGYDPSAEDSED